MDHGKILQSAVDKENDWWNRMGYELLKKTGGYNGQNIIIRNYVEEISPIIQESVKLFLYMNVIKSFHM